MKIAVDIPQTVAEQFELYPNITRRGLIQRTGITEYEAKIFTYLKNNGTTIAYHKTNLNPQSGKTMTALILADLHIPYHDSGAINIALDWGLSKNPDMVILNGDGFDCYKVSHWKTDPTRCDFGTEVNISTDEFCKIDEKISSCNSIKEKNYIAGNHEDRLRRELWSGSKKLAGLDILKIPNVYGLNALGWNYIDNAQILREGGRPFRLGKLTILHGHEVKVNYSVVNIPRVYYQRCLVNLLVGHYHRTQEHIESKLDGTHEGAWSMGCLCKLAQEYAPFSKFNFGVSLVEWDATGDFSVTNKKIIGGKVL